MPRAQLIRAAFRLEWLTMAWMVLEAAIALAAGLMARSVSLIAFGVDSLIELASAGVLIWRLVVELRRGEAFARATEPHRWSAAVCARGLCRVGGRMEPVDTPRGGILVAGAVRQPRGHPGSVASVPAEIAGRRCPRESGVAHRCH